MATFKHNFIPFESMNGKQQAEHLAIAHAFDDEYLQVESLAVATDYWQDHTRAYRRGVHREDHLQYDGGGAAGRTHSHTKMPAKKKRAV